MKAIRGRTAIILGTGLVAAVLLIVAGTRIASQDEAGGEHRASSESRLDALVRHRRASMKQIGKRMRAVIAFAKGGPGSFEEVAAHASVIKAIAEQMPEMFPEGSGMDDKLSVETGALPEIWVDWASFTKQAEILSVEASKLKDIAETGDRSSLQEQFMSLGRNGCSNCHEAYREKI